VVFWSANDDPLSLRHCRSGESSKMRLVWGKTAAGQSDRLVKMILWLVQTPDEKRTMLDARATTLCPQEPRPPAPVACRWFPHFSLLTCAERQKTSPSDGETAQACLAQQAKSAAP